MYEFVDAHGERVTVRSVRTLGGLLQSGAITAATPFRRAGAPTFGPAEANSELQELAASIGVPLGAPRPIPDQRPPAPPPVDAARLPPSQPDQPRAPPARAGVPQVERLVQRASPWSRVAPPRRRSRVKPFARCIGLILLHLCGASVLGVVARAAVANASASRAWAELAMVAVTALFAHFAGQALARRWPRPNGWSVSLASALFTGGAYALSGSAGLIVGLAASIMLWRSLSQPLR